MPRAAKTNKNKQAKKKRMMPRRKKKMNTKVKKMKVMKSFIKDPNLIIASISCQK
jgi:hypothetical protein